MVTVEGQETSSRLNSVQRVQLPYKVGGHHARALGNESERYDPTDRVSDTLHGVRKTKEK